MKVINARNVNDALEKGIDLFQDPSEYTVKDSRNGIVCEANTPVTTVYEKPWERVCLIKERDANPFFHFIEGLWMLDNRNDLAPLTYFVKSMEDFSDDGKTLWGAYGWRWNGYWIFSDQVTMIIKMLKDNPYERRAVLQMWDPEEDLARKGKDVPCNTNIYFKIRDGRLCMTVCNRSNDMLWGAYGANVVHMSMLQEYIAHHLDLPMGTYTQISDSFHIYQNDAWDRVKHMELDIYTYRNKKNHYDLIDGYEPVPLVNETESFSRELRFFFDFFKSYRFAPDDFINRSDDIEWNNNIFPDVAMPMLKAFHYHKERNYLNSYREVQKIKSLDWMEACFEWIRKRDTAYTLNNAEKGENE
jgi:hypothetical protein